MNIKKLPLLTLSLLTILLGFDLISVIILFQPETAITASIAGNYLPIAFGLHLTCSILATYLLGRELHTQSNPQQYRHFYSLVFQFVLFLPVIGFIAAFIFAYHPLFINVQDKKSQKTESLFLAQEPENLDYSLGEEKQFRELLRHQNPESYLQLILSTRYMDERNAVRILKYALNTDIENVRLLAQARLDTKENEINQAIDQSIAMSQTDKHRKNTHLYLEIAQHYWTLADLGLAKDAVLDHVLKQLQKYARIVQLIQPDEPKGYYLAGKGFLLNRNLKQAKLQFRMSFKTGMPKSKVLPFLREIAFYENIKDNVLHTTMTKDIMV